MATEFSDILSRNIIHICFGEDLSDDALDFQVYDNEVGRWTTKKLTIKEAVFLIVDQVITIFYKNCRNPLNWLYPHTERILPTSSDSRRIEDNCLVARNWIKDYIT